MNITKRYSENRNYNLDIISPDKVILFSLDNSKLVDSNTISQQARSTKIIA